MADNSLKKGRYTKYSNKIGLFSNSRGGFVKNDTGVILNFPFKDTVLEAGMSKEDIGREERFLHLEIDSKDIDTLKEPKVLTDFRLINEHGETPLTASSDVEFFDEDGNLQQNLLIKGNNLLALYTLSEKLAGKVKLIYIDPPYNTGSDGWKYNDKFSHSAWLAFMKNRLEVARELLSDDGSIFIQCDENENAYLRILMDEIFGRENLVNEIIWRYRTYVGQVKDYFPKKHDTIFWYKKSARPDFQLTYEDNLEETVDYKRWSKFLVDGNQIKYGNHPTTDSRFTAYLKKYIKQHGQPEEGEVIYEVRGYVIDDVWEDIIALDPKNLTERTNFTGGQKPEALIQRIIESVTKEGDIVLDYHLGSGTTSAVAHKMGRRWVGVEQMDYIDTLAKVRLKKVLEGEQGGISNAVGWNGGGSFVYFELKKYNQEYVERIMEATSLSELEDIYVDMRNNAFLKFWFDRSHFEKDEDFRQLDLDGRKNALADVLDENQLYLNYGDMNDTRHNVTADEKALTDTFYGTN
ncbi:MAG: site-specific DNA-methyltransferase [Candidatus Microsaccharimonas sp.]